MRVLHVLPSLTAGGAEGFITNLSVSLCSLGLEVKLFVLGGVRGERGRVLHKRLMEAGIDLAGAEDRRPASLSNLLGLTNLIRLWRPDIVQANLYPAEVACAAAKLLCPGRKICYVRRLANTDFCAYRSRWAVKRLALFFPTVIACSEAVAASYCRFMGNSAQPEVVVIANGGLFPESSPEPQDKREARRNLGISDGAFVVAHIGRMYPGGRTWSGGLETGQKAHDVLIQAFAKAFSEDREAIIVLVGDGPLRPEAEALVRKLGIGEQVRFLGQQPEPWPALLAADLLCFPSRHEGLPNVLPEAASCGLPIVASDIPEIRSLYRGDAWLLTPVDDVEHLAGALRTVRDNMSLFTSRARDAAKIFREMFSMTNCAEEYLRAYSKTIESMRR